MSELSLVEKFKIAACIVGITIMGSTQGITMPILIVHYPSIYFILLLTSIEFVVVFGTIYIVISIIKLKKLFIPEKRHLLTLVKSGAGSAAASLFLAYSVNPERTPIIIQTVISGLIILPSVAFTKLILSKIVHYNLKFIIPSLILSALALGISAIPIIMDSVSKSTSWNPIGIVWILAFLIGIALTSLFNIYQEKYLTETGDGQILNKVTVVFISRLVQLICIGILFWIEYIPYINYEGNPSTQFVESIQTFFSFKIEFWLMQIFIFAFLILYSLSVYLNSISTNYNMISMAATNPCIALFFTVFSFLNPGIKFPIYVTILSLLCSGVSILLWIKGETKVKYQVISEIDPLIQDKPIEI